MSQIAKGTVKSTIKGKKTFSSPQGSLATYTIVLETSEGELKVQRNGLANSNFNIQPGTEVQVTFDSKVITSKDGSFEDFTVNTVVKDGILVFKGNETLSVDSKGNPKPLFVKSETTSKTPAKGNPSPVQTTSKATPGKSTGYSNEGARNGMIVNASIALASAREELTLDNLLKAVDDVKLITEYVETGVLVKHSLKALDLVGDENQEDLDDEITFNI